MNEKIEEMANDLEEEFVLCGTLSNCGTKRCSRCFSKYLYEQGYRKESDTAREILVPLIECEKQIDPLKTGIRWLVLKGFCKKFDIEVD